MTGRPDDGTGRRGPAAEPEATYVLRNDDEWRDDELPETIPSGATVEADRRDAAADHVPDLPDRPGAPSAEDGAGGASDEPAGRGSDDPRGQGPEAQPQ
ncbi:MAG: hypothetical protein U0P45_07550 [Acidimicrobiales bacterium]